MGFDPADYERIVEAAAIEELSPTEFIRNAALRALPVYLRNGQRGPSGPVDDK